MKDLPDSVLITRVTSEACSEAFAELSRRYENAFYKICHRYTAALIRSGVNPQDVFDEKNIILLNCVKTYDPGKGSKLSTWICNYARYLCLNSMNARKCILSVEDSDLKELIDNSSFSEDFRDKTSQLEDFAFLKNIISQIKDPRIAKIIKMRHLSDGKREWKHIAEKMNISSQTVINLHERGMKLLRKKFLSKDNSDII